MYSSNIHQAKTNLSKLIERTLAGEDVVIAKAGTPVVRLVEYKTPAKKRTPGALKGKILLAPDFSEESTQIIDQFYGKD